MSERCPKCGAAKISSVVMGYGRYGPPILEAITHHVDGPECVLRQLAAVTAERDKLRAELVDWLDIVMRTEAQYVTVGDFAGWWDTGGIGGPVSIGDRLLELGTWERHPNGYGRRWFYRPVVKAAEAAREEP